MMVQYIKRRNIRKKGGAHLARWNDVVYSFNARRKCARPDQMFVYVIRMPAGGQCVDIFTTEPQMLPSSSSEAT